MGASADEIDREISATREQVDRNLTILERRAMTGARRYGVMAAAGLAAGLVVAGAAYLAYRRLRKQPDTIGNLTGSVREKFKRRPVRVVISSGEDREPVWKSILRKAAPAVVTSIAGAAVSRTVASRRQPRD